MSARTLASQSFIGNCAEMSCHYIATGANGGPKMAKLGERITTWQSAAEIGYVRSKFDSLNDFACLKQPLI